MKILLLNSNRAIGGAERFMSELCRHLPHDIERTVILRHPLDMQFDARTRIVPPPAARSGALGSIRNYLTLVQQLHKLLIEEQPDWIIPLDWRSALACVAVSRKVIARANCHYSLGAPTLWERVRIRLAYSLAQKLVTTCNGVKDDLRTLGVLQPAIVIHNAVDIAAIAHHASLQSDNSTFNAWTNTQIPIVITSGRLEEQKGHEHLLRAFADTRKRCPARLVILGTGSRELSLIQMAKDLGIADNVLFVGFTENPFLYLARATVFVSTSRREAFANAVIEAMATGLPIIATDCHSGPRELLAPDNGPASTAKTVEYATYGILTPSPDPWGALLSATDPLSHEERALSEALQTLLTNPERRKEYATKGRLRAESFNIKEWTAKWLEVLEYSHVT